MMAFIVTMTIAAATVSQGEFEAQAKACKIDIEPYWKPPHWRAKRSDDGTVVMVTAFTGQEAETRCLADWARERGIIFMLMRD
jgi:hypothetical protein